jgi:hypothetical protein
MQNTDNFCITKNKLIGEIYFFSFDARFMIKGQEDFRTLFLRIYWTSNNSFVRGNNIFDHLARYLFFEYHRIWIYFWFKLKRTLLFENRAKSSWSKVGHKLQICILLFNKKNELTEDVIHFRRKDSSWKCWTLMASFLVYFRWWLYCSWYVLIFNVLQNT